MCLHRTQVFVLDIAGRPAFAFEAADHDGARRLARSERLLQALDDYCRAKRLGAGGQLQIRAATMAEAASYYDMADEFAETAPRLLVARITGA
ncbi:MULTISPECIES: hypothetical protein [unclassified Bradyrhizobium]|uniref:hypothetical protein n=1 Tax=unclassified Bradyrhizobium TaxID=2631580 RepID=UPI0028F10C48|nr:MULTISPECIES: hypothetical protein [unclassified Bradyrhizobium]